MTEMPVQRSGAAPDDVEDPMVAAERIVADPSQAGSAEWLAAKQLLAERRGGEAQSLSDLDKEMQALKGMSQI